MSELAAIQSEIFVRLLEMEEIRKGAGPIFVNRLSAVAGASHSALYSLLWVGSGQTEKVLGSYEEQVKKRGVTRQALHWLWQQDIDRLRKHGFPQIAEAMQHYRDTVAHHEDAMSAADALRRGRDSAGGGDHD